jgi:hypothetical protein
MAAPVVAEEEDILMGTDHIRTAITTPVATPMGMTTYGLDVVVKFDAPSTLRAVAFRLA